MFFQKFDDRDRPVLTVVIVHFNTPELTADCVKSLVAIFAASTLATAYEIVVIDNRSETAHFEALSASLGAMANNRLILARNCLNAGFGLGCMLGLNYSAGKYVAFVNSDTSFDEDAFTPLVAYMDANDDVGVTGPTHKDMNGRVCRSFGEFNTLASRVFGRWLGSRFSAQRPPDPKATYDRPVTVDFVYGSFMMFRLEALAAAGGFDPNIFLFYEEMDICYRLKALGYKAVYYSGASFRHIGQASFAKPEIIKLESDISLLYIVRKNGDSSTISYFI